MTLKLKIAAAGIGLAMLAAAPLPAISLLGDGGPQLQGRAPIERAKECKPDTVSVRECIRGRQMLCRYRVTVSCKRKRLDCREAGPPCFSPF